MDAPVGYLSSIQNWANQNDIEYADLMNEDNVKLVHFIGKDIVYFHLLFWPAMLKTYGVNNLDEVFVHGFLTIEGSKDVQIKRQFHSCGQGSDFCTPRLL